MTFPTQPKAGDVHIDESGRRWVFTPEPDDEGIIFQPPKPLPLRHREPGWNGVLPKDGVSNR